MTQYRYIFLIPILVLGFTFTIVMTSFTTAPNNMEEAKASEFKTTFKDSKSNIGVYHEIQKLETSSLKKNEIHVLFFSSSSCNSCLDLDKDLKLNRDKIPLDINIYNVDLEDNNDLRGQYSVTEKHTLTQIDSTGQEIQRWTGSTELENILTQIKPF